MALENITLTPTLPSGIVAAENPIVVSLSTGVVGGSPAYAKGKITVVNNTTNNDQIIFNLTGSTNYYKVFTGKRYPNSDSYFLTDTLEDKNGNSISTSITTSQIASSISDCLNKDSVISNLYYVNYSGGTIVYLTAKEVGTTFKLSGQVTTTSGDITFTNISNGANQFEGSLVPNYQMYVELYVGDPSEQLIYLLGGSPDLSKYNYVTDIVLPFSLDNIHRFDFGKVCKSFVSTPRPNFNLTGATSFENEDQQIMRSFLFRYGELYPIAGGNTTKKLYKGSTSPFWVVNSSLPFTEDNDMEPFTGSSINVNGKYFTNSPSIKYSQRNQKELLYFTITKYAAQNRDIGMYADLTFWDGSTANDVLLYRFLSYENNYGGMYVANVSFEDHLQQFETTSRIKTAVINARAFSGGTNFTVKKTYQYPYSDPINSYQLTFLNKLGGFDTHTFIGLVEHQIDRTKKDITTAIPVNANGSVNQGFKYSGNYDVQITKKVMVNSGLLTETMFDWLLELLQSNDIYQIDNDNINYLKLDSFKYSKNTNSNDYSIECTFIQTIYENNVSI